MEVIKSYAGIGSREITFEEKDLIFKIANKLKEHYTVYSGNADGADITFQMGAEPYFVAFLPWANFNKENFDFTLGHSNVLNILDEDAINSVRKFHPSPFSLSAGASKLMARNYKQVMGDPREKLPAVDFVICCANGTHKSVAGGTGQAVRIATEHGIPVVNIRVKDWQKKLTEITNIDFTKF
jgi:hypothetical protein